MREPKTKTQAKTRAKPWAKPWVSSVAWAYPPSYGLTRTERVKRVAELRQRTGLSIREVCALLIWHEYDIKAAVKAWKAASKPTHNPEAP